MPLDLLAEWMAFYRIEPFGDEWRRSARAATWTVAAAGAKVTDGFEDRFIPGGGQYRGMSAHEAAALDQLRQLPGFENHLKD